MEHAGQELVTVQTVVPISIAITPPTCKARISNCQMISQWGRFLEAADVPSTMIVGVHRVADETLRLHDYSPKFDPERFAAHERFFVEDVGVWARSRFGVTLPSSARPCLVFRQVESSRLLLGFDIPSSTARSSQPRPARGTGRLTQGRVDCRTRTWWPAPEPFFLDNAARWAAELRDATADVVMSERAAGHEDDMCRREFPLMIRWAFGRNQL
jgi:hypothetical protein